MRVPNHSFGNSGDSLDQYRLNLPDPATPIAFGIHSLHNHILFFLCIILVTVLFLLFSILYHFSFYDDKYYSPLYYVHVCAKAFSRLTLGVLRFVLSGFDAFFKTEALKGGAFISAYTLTGFWLLTAAFAKPGDSTGCTNTRFRFLSIARQLPLYRKLYNGIVYAINHFTVFKRGKSVQYYVTKGGIFDYVSIFNEVCNYPKTRAQWLTYLVLNRQYRVTHNLELEVIWTIIPTLILVTIAIPSFALLYSMDELLDPTVTVKIIGHQWYWSYEYSDLKPLVGTSVSFDSYMVPDADLVPGDLRLLKTDCPLVLPKETNIRFLITSTDVLHSWAVPSFGIKMDAVPGRLNQTSAYIMESGRYYGQCSELCGVNHGFMPIEICVVGPVDYYNWLFLKSE